MQLRTDPDSTPAVQAGLLLNTLDDDLAALNRLLLVLRDRHDPVNPSRPNSNVVASPTLVAPSVADSTPPCGATSPTPSRRADHPPPRRACIGSTTVDYVTRCRHDATVTAPDTDGGAEWTTFLTLATTLDTVGGACVAGVDSDGRWLRPAPVTRHDVVGPTARFHMHSWLRLRLGSAPGSSARPEDCLLQAPPAPFLTTSTCNVDVVQRRAGATVFSTLRDGRSAGLIEVRPLDLYERLSTGGRRFLRLRFHDAADQEYDWIVRDLRFLAMQDSAAGEWDNVLSVLQPQVLLAIGLTLPDNRFPGLFEGCHPLVVGIHGDACDLFRKV